jgi:hypothetical protein
MYDKHRRMAWGVQKGRRLPQVARLTDSVGGYLPAGLVVRIEVTSRSAILYF